MADRSDSSRRWLKEHFNDPYVKQAQKEGYRSRSAYKLLEINKRDRLFKPGMKVIDLGAAPGGWSQVAIKFIRPKGSIYALDLLPMDDVPHVDFIQGDFSDDQVLADMMAKIGDEKADWVLSDISPNMSGTDSVDIPRSIYIAELVLDFALTILRPQGGMLIKVFQGEGFDAYLADVKGRFKKTAIRKPKASRGRSKEVYILARGLR